MAKALEQSQSRMLASMAPALSLLAVILAASGIRSQLLRQA